MSRSTWRSVILMAVVLVVMGSSAGYKLYVASPPAVEVALATRTIDGDIAQTPTGPLQVRITMTDSQVVAIEELETATAYTRSRAINDRAIPLLKHAALEAQSAEIDSVSGATYTSEAYRQSLQSAIDRA